MSPIIQNHLKLETDKGISTCSSVCLSKSLERLTNLDRTRERERENVAVKPSHPISSTHQLELNSTRGFNLRFDVGETCEVSTCTYLLMTWALVIIHQQRVCAETNDPKVLASDKNLSRLRLHVASKWTLNYLSAWNSYWLPEQWEHPRRARVVPRIWEGDIQIHILHPFFQIIKMWYYVLISDWKYCTYITKWKTNRD